MLFVDGWVLKFQHLLAHGKNAGPDILLPLQGIIIPGDSGSRIRHDWYLYPLNDLPSCIVCRDDSSSQELFD